MNVWNEKRKRQVTQLIIYKKMTIDDIEEVSKMEERCFSMPWSKDAYEQALQCDDVVYVVATNEERIIGSCGVRNILSEGEITNVMVDAPFRGQKISYPMLQMLLEEGKKIGIEQFFLEVRAGNKPAISLYEKCGFQVEGVRKNLYEMPKEDGLIMWKR